MSMKKTTFYGLFVLIPTILMIGYRYFLQVTEEAFLRGESISEPYVQVLYTLIPTFLVMLLIFIALYSVKYMREMNFRLIAFVCFAIYLTLSVSHLFTPILIENVSGIRYLLQDFPKYAGFYGGIFVYSIFHKK